ncbi:MAG: helix-turn-helix transcriptional regulator [Alicyclobacillus sp.]|nr:helix-turn-helix transcriptional regulator [Alicyclobacillus sp.]
MRDAIARRLIALRGDQSREEVARAVGISVSALQMYENAQRTPRDDIKIRLAQYYGVSVESLFYANDEHNSCSAEHTA